ncbi:MAG TPA: hypothetical protein VNQ76_16985 [Planctomicrobium sp.]|nr:hypothetical protein [Planctomicrobium sp.]
MMRFSVVTRAMTGIFTMTALLAVSSTAVDAADKVLAEKRLPSGVLFYVTSPDVVAAYDQFQKTGAGQLFRDPSLEKFRGQIAELYEEFRAESEEKTGLKVSDVVGVFNGEVSIAVVRPVGQPLGWVSFLEYGDRKVTIDALLKRSREKVESEERVTVETEDVDGNSVTTYTIENPNTDTPITVSLLQKDGLLVAASGVSVLESVLERWDGKHDDTFAGNKVYQTIYKNCVTGDITKPGFVYFVDPIGLLASGLSMSPQTQNFAGMIYMPTLGLNGLKAIGGVHEFATKDFDSIGRSMVYLEGAPTGVIKVFQLRSNPLEVPTWVPADASQYLTLDWDIKGAYEAIESIYDSFLGTGRFAMATANLLQQAGVDLKLKPDVIDVLSGKFEGYYNVGATSPEDFKGLLSVGVTDSAKGQKLVDAVWKLAGGARSSDVDGAKLYEPAGDDVPGAVAVKGNSIFLSTQADNVKSALSARSSTASLTASDDFKAAVKFVPGNVSLFSFQNASGQIEEVYEKARDGEFDGLTEGKLDFSVLPPFEVLKKYITPTVGYYIPDENGTIGVQFSLRSKK